MIQVLPLRGFNSLKALNAFSALLLGLKMLPAYIAITMEDFYGAFIEMSEGEKEARLREAVAFVKLEQDEVESIICFTKDKNGITHSRENLKNLDVKELHEIIVAVCMEIGKIKISLTSESEKKN